MENKIGEFKFNVEKSSTFIVVDNNNFSVSIGDLVIEDMSNIKENVIKSIYS